MAERRLIMPNKLYCGYDSAEIVKASLLVDAQKFADKESIDPQKYAIDNYRQYTIAINTWLSLLEDFNVLPTSLPGMIAREGLVAMIEKFVNTASDIMSNQPFKANAGCSQEVSIRFMQTHTLKEVQGLLLCLRYLKRFSPVSVTVDSQATIDSFLKRNKYAKTQNVPDGRLSHLQHRVYQYMRPTIEKLELYLHPETPKFLPLTSEGPLPNGATAGGEKTIAQKLLAVEKYLPNYLPLSGVREILSEPQLPTTQFGPVAKAYNKSRGIASEDAYRTVLSFKPAAELTTGLREYTNGRVDLTNSERNQEFARMGAADGSLATIDFSAASDSVYLGHIRALFKKAPYLERWRPRFVQVGKKKYRLNLYATMGSRLTFPVETAFFLAIAEGAYRYYECLTNESLDYSTICVYGDDLIVDARVVDVVFWFCRVLGLTINSDKSFYNENQNIQFFGNSRYRESCGSEWLYCPEFDEVLDVSHPFFPRKSIPDTAVGLYRTLALQHKLVSYAGTNAWLTEYIRDWFETLYPQYELTESEVGSNYSDIWSYWPNISRSSTPIHDGISPNCEGMYEYHTSFKTRYDTSYRASFTEREAAYRLLYYRFLSNGNKSNEKLLALLNVTERRTSPREVYLPVDEDGLSVGYTF